MFIVPLFPALFANRLLADWTSHTRGSAPLLPILCTQFSSELLSVAHSTVFPWRQPKTHPHVGTLICCHTCSAFVLHSYFCFLCWWMCNTCGDSIQAKKHLPQSHGTKGSCRIKFGLSGGLLLSVRYRQLTALGQPLVPHVDPYICLATRAPTWCCVHWWARPKGRGRDESAQVPYATHFVPFLKFFHRLAG